MKLVLFLSAFALLAGVGMLACSSIVANVSLDAAFLKSAGSRRTLAGLLIIPCLTGAFAYHKMARTIIAANRK